MSKGNRPEFSEAVRPDTAEPLYSHFCESLAAEGISVATGRFRLAMEVELVNDGPVTIILG